MRTSIGLDDGRQRYSDLSGIFFEESNTDKIRKASEIVGKVVASELTDRQRECLSLYYYEGCTMPQIAQALGINKSSVSRAISRGKARIKRSMKYVMQMNSEAF